MCALAKKKKSKKSLLTNKFFKFLAAVRKARPNLSVDHALILAWRTWNGYSQFQREVFIARPEFDSVCTLAKKFTAYNQRPKKRRDTKKRRK